VDTDAVSGRLEVKGVFVFQACTKTSCARAKESRFSLALEIEVLPTFGPPAELPPPEPVRVSWKLEPARVRQGDAAVLVMEMFRRAGLPRLPSGRAERPSRPDEDDAGEGRRARGPESAIRRATRRCPRSGVGRDAKRLLERTAPS